MEVRYNTRMKECKTEGEMVDYLLSCIPVIKEYTDAEQAEPQIESKKIFGVEVKMRKGMQRMDIFNKYMSEVEGDFKYVQKKDDTHSPCTRCGTMYSRILDEISSEEICSNCGQMTFFLGEQMGFKEEQEMEQNIVYSYKRENHFNEWISQFQAKESTSVPEDVITKLRFEFKKQKIKDLSEITHEKVKALLKKLGYAKYYEHVAYISTILNGVTPPTMSQALEDKLRLMFHKIQEPFARHKPEARKNFLSYSYVLYKFCELLGEDDYLPCFPLLKSKEKLYVQDQIWEKICEELQWQFIKTV